MQENKNSSFVDRAAKDFYIIAVVIVGIHMIFSKTPKFVVCGLVIAQALIVLAVRPIGESLYIRKAKSRKVKHLFAAEQYSQVILCRGKNYAVRLCVFGLLLCALIAFLGSRLWWSKVDDPIVVKLVGIWLPLLCGFLLMPVYYETPQMKLRVLRRNNSIAELRQKKIWIIVNQTKFSVQSQCVIHDGKPAYLVTKDELHCITQEKMSDQEFMEKSPRLCYLVQVSTQEQLKEIFDEIYADYLNSENDGLRKIAVVNVRTLTTQSQLHCPEEYLRQEFLYFAEIKHMSDFTYKFLGELCGDSLDNFSISINDNQDKEVTREERKKNIERLRQDFDSTHLQYFKHPHMLRQRIHESVTYEEETNIKNMWLLSFYNSACVFQNPTRSVMALLDYWELLLRLVAIYYYQATEEPSICEEELVHANLGTLGRFISEASVIHLDHYKLLTEKTFETPEVILVYLDKLTDYIYIHFTGESVSFPGLVSLMQVLRNKVIAHGVLNDENASIVWGITFWATDLLNSYLLLSDFQLNETGSTYEIGFETTVRADRLIVNRGGYPCIAAIQKSNKKSYIYVNFFNGELITPEFVEVDPA